MGDPVRRLTFDPHVHTDASHDCSTPLEDVLAAADEADLDAVAITDHDAIGTSLRAVERAPEYGLVAVPGVEVSTADGHLLALFVTERPPAGKSLHDTVGWVRARNGVAIVPHPFQVSRHGVRKRRLADCDVDGLETYNAQSLTGVQNRRAGRYARRADVAPIGASDAHSAGTIGRAFTVLECSPAVSRAQGNVTARAVRTALLEGETRPAGERVTVGQYVGKYARQLGNRTARLRPGRLFSTDRS